jgi:hypothetical protein
MKKLLFLFAISCSSLSYGQLALPEGFRCEKSEKPGDYYTDGKYQFTLHPYQQEGIAKNELVNVVRRRMGIKPDITTGGIYIWNGKNNGKFRYVILVPQLVMKIELVSELNDSKYLNLSKWLLRQVRDKIDNGKDIYLTASDGKTCN